MGISGYTPLPRNKACWPTFSLNNCNKAFFPASKTGIGRGDLEKFPIDSGCRFEENLGTSAFQIPVVSNCWCGNAASSWPTVAIDKRQKWQWMRKQNLTSLVWKNMFRIRNSMRGTYVKICEVWLFFIILDSPWSVMPFLLQDVCDFSENYPESRFRPVME